MLMLFIWFCAMLLGCALGSMLTAVFLPATMSLGVGLAITLLGVLLWAGGVYSYVARNAPLVNAERNRYHEEWRARAEERHRR
jgi:hypothetical protein